LQAINHLNTPDDTRISLINFKLTTALLLADSIQLVKTVGGEVEGLCKHEYKAINF